MICEKKLAMHFTRDGVESIVRMETSRQWSQPVWSDNGVKSSPIFQKLPKHNQNNVYLESDIFHS